MLPPETGETFAENALDKARAAAAATGRVTIADDSGIAAEALGGRPGVRSARFAGEHASDEENLAKLLREAPAGSRVAYVCALAYVEPHAPVEPLAEGGGGGAAPAGPHAPVERLVEGRGEGPLAAEPRGSGGFGYDPAFVPDDRDEGLTMAELAPQDKAAISHRGRAARALLEWLEGQAGDRGGD